MDVIYYDFVASERSSTLRLELAFCDSTESAGAFEDHHATTLSRPGLTTNPRAS